MVYCSECNTIYAPGTRYCKQCKTHLSFLPSDSNDETQIKCPSCGEITSVESGKCQFCEKTLSAESLDLSQAVPVNDTQPEIPKTKSKGKRKKTSPASSSHENKSSRIEALKCPKCGNMVLIDFENCPQCGTKVQSSGSPEKQLAPAPLQNEKQNVVPVTETPPPPEETQKQPVEEVVWETIECPACHKTTRVDTGHCRHCNAPLKPEPVKVEEPAVNQKPIETVAVQEPIATPPQKSLEKVLSPVSVTSVSSVTTVAPVKDPEPSAVAPVIQDKNQTYPSSVWLLVTVIGLVGVVILAGILVTIYSWKHSQNSAKPVQVISQSMPIANPPPSVPTVSNDTDTLLQTLNNVRQAMFSKDTVLYLSAFSPQFQDLQQKQMGLNTLWKTYQIQDLKYDISADHPLSIKDNQADIVISWKMNLRKISNNKTVSMNENDYVRFEKQNGNWKIVEVSLR